MGKKLFVRNVHPGIMEDELKEYFEVIGPVISCDLMIDKQTGRSRGFAFIEMEEDHDARRAIKEMDGKECEGKSLAVKEARPRENRGRRPRQPRTRR